MYRIRHAGGWQVNLYLSPSLVSELEEEGSPSRQAARLYLCRHFREVCEDQFFDFNLRYVLWDEIEIESLSLESPTAPITSPLLVPDLAKG